MKCPKCGYVRQVSDTAPGYECPRCGVVYEKAAENLRSTSQPLESSSVASAFDHKRAPDSLGKCVDCNGLLSPRAVICPHCGRLLGGELFPPVAVKDVQMPFNSMVSFMVKWAIASIPAIIILTAIAVAVVVLLSGLMHR